MQLRREEEGDGGGARACVTFASVDRAARARKDPRPRNFAPIDRPTQSALPARMRGGIGQTGARFPVARCVRLTSPAHLSASRAPQTGAHLCEKIAGRTDGRGRILLGRERTRSAAAKQLPISVARSISYFK